MKKIIFAAAFIFTTGIFASCNKETSVRTASVIIIKTFIGDKKNLASAD
jgi:hypothetical protein